MLIRSIISIFFGIFLSLAVRAETPLPDVGSSATQALSTSQENFLGDYIMETLRAQNALNLDPALADYIQSLGDRLVSHSEDAKRRYHFFIVNEPHVNAFALPGAWVAVHSGLFLQTRRESELAAVMAHEVAHVSQRHIARMFEKAKQMNIPSIAAMVAAAALTVAVPAVGTAALAGVMAGQQQIQIDFTRHNEEEADRIGIDTLAKSDFDVHSMAGFFGRMQELSRYNDSQAVPEFLRTHPMSANRMADAQNRAGRYQNNAVHESELYNFMKERLRVLTTSTNELQAYYAKAKLDVPSLRYGKALMLLQLRDAQGARDVLAPLVNPQMPPVIALLQATILTKTGDVAQGLALAKATQEKDPENKGMSLTLADLYLDNNNAEAAKTLMRHELLLDPDDPDFHERLARAYQKLGDKKLTYLAQGDYSMSIHLYERAMFELKLAEKTPPKTTYYQSLIKAKIKENEALMEKQNRLKKSTGVK
ncbi:MAG: M48 family metalloprotease [Gammaproteobacteria bacterium]